MKKLLKNFRAARAKKFLKFLNSDLRTFSLQTDRNFYRNFSGFKNKFAAENRNFCGQKFLKFLFNPRQKFVPENEEFEPKNRKH